MQNLIRLDANELLLVMGGDWASWIVPTIISGSCAAIAASFFVIAKCSHENEEYLSPTCHASDYSLIANSGAISATNEASLAKHIMYFCITFSILSGIWAVYEALRTR